MRVEVHNGVHTRARTGSLGPNERYRILMKRRVAKQGETVRDGFSNPNGAGSSPATPSNPLKTKNLPRVLCASKPP